MPTTGGGNVGFAADTAAVTGESKQSINKKVARGTKIASDVLDAITGSKWDSGVNLDILKKRKSRRPAPDHGTRNVASAISSPKVEYVEVEALSAGQMAQVIAKLAGHRLLPIAALALATGLRRGELLALRWCDIDLDGAVLKVERSLEETKAGLRFKVPKTRHGRRTLSLPASAIEPLRVHRKAQLELRMALGIGRPEADALIFGTPEGAPLSPDNLSRDWKQAVKSLGLPEIMFHALRHKRLAEHLPPSRTHGAAACPSSHPSSEQITQMTESPPRPAIKPD